MADIDLPRWMTQGTPSIGVAATNNLRVVTPDELEMASKMYGAVSQQSFKFANMIAYQIGRLGKDYDEMLSNEAMATADKVLRESSVNNEIAKDGPTYRKAMAPVIKDATKDMGPVSSWTARNMLAKQAIKYAQQIDSRILNTAATEIMKSQTEEQEKFLVNAAANYPIKTTPEEQQKYIENASQTYVGFLPNIPEEMKNIAVKKMQDTLRTASVANEYIAVGSRMDLESVKETNALFKKHEEYFKNYVNDEEEMGRFREILSKGLKVKLSEDNFKELVVEARSKSVIEKVRTEMSSEPDPVRRRSIWSKAVQENTGYDTYNNIRSLGHEFGFMSSDVGGGTRLSKSYSSNAMFQKGINAELPLEKLNEMAKQGGITRLQYNAYMDGYKKRNKAYDAYDKNFYADTKLRTGINLEPGGGKNDEILAMAMGNQSDIALKKRIMEKKAALVGLPDVEYQKELGKLTEYATQKQRENALKKQEAYKGKSQSETLMSKYAR